VTDMKKKALRIAIPVVLVAVAAAWAQQSPPPAPAQAPAQADRQGTIVRNVNLVDVLFSVVTKREKLVTDLNKEDFKVFDDGVQQEITAFSQPTDLPLRIGMVLDTSNSIRDRLKFEQDAAIDFLFNAIRRERDQAFLMTFDDGPQIIKDFSGDTGDLRDTILKQRAGGGTSLYDAVYAASQQLLTKSPPPPGPNTDVRRVLVVISDGDDNSSNRSRGAAVEMAQRAGVIIYSISTSTQWVNIDDQRNASTANMKRAKGITFLSSSLRKPAGARFSLIESMISGSHSWILGTNCATNMLSLTVPAIAPPTDDSTRFAFRSLEKM
jgi:Ca-activated chloride channel family protein